MLECAFRRLMTSQARDKHNKFCVVEILPRLLADLDHLYTGLQVPNVLGQAKPDRAGRLERFHYRAAGKTIDLKPPRGRRRLDRGNVNRRKRPGIRKNPKRVVGEARNTAAVLQE